jgi:antitoxin component YwqK of YwqJK toxin-antitoxin module
MWNSFVGSKKSTRIIVLAAAVSIGALAFAGGFYATRTDTIEITDVYPEKLPVQAELHEGETLRNVEFYPDNITPRHAVAFNADGTLTDYWYRENGTLSKAETVKENENGTRTLLRSAVFLDDGKTYKHDIEYFDDGISVRKELVLTDLQTQHRKYFHANGVVREDQVILLDRRGWKLSTESEFREDSSLVSTYKSGENDAWERKSFDEKGVLTMSKAVSKWGSEYTEITYANGGVPVREVVQNSSQTKLIIRRADGTVSEERWWYGPLVKAMMTVTYFDTQGRKTFYQSYGSLGDGKYELSTITIFAKNGDDQRTVYFESDGELNETVYKDGDKSRWTRRLYRKDRSLSEEIDMEMGKGEVGRRQFPEDTTLRFEIPDKYVAFEKFITPDQVLEYHPPYNGH